jgi:hypothetical protein
VCVAGAKKKKETITTKKKVAQVLIFCCGCGKLLDMFFEKCILMVTNAFGPAPPNPTAGLFYSRMLS